MNMQHEEQLQRKIEAGEMPQAPDAAAYKKVFDILRQEPSPLRLPDNFADKVITRIDVRSASLTGDYLWFGIGMLLILISGAVGFAFSGVTINLTFLNALKPLKGLFVFALIFIVAIHLLDKHVLKVSHHKKGLSI
jgi:hypothetical protein